MLNRVLTVLAHPDDETLGCGGTIHKFAEKGIEVSCLIPVKRIELQCIEALETLGVSGSHFGSFDDQQLDKYPLLDLAKFVYRGIERFDPDIIITHHHNCTNQDHRLMHQAVIIATRPQFDKKRIQVFSCEVMSSTGYLRPTGFEPNYYVSLSEENIKAKMQAIEDYATELKPTRSPEVLKSLARVRGAESGTEYAEGFMLVRGFDE